MHRQHPCPGGAARRKRQCLTLSGISKSFPGVRALSGVALELYPGEVTALVGENGAGKSTLVKILTGIYQPDEGTIRLAGEDVTFPTAHDAAKAGITAIHQETVLFDELSVAENIFLGHAPRGRFGLIDWKQNAPQAASLLDRIGARIAPETRLRDLGIASRHLVAIARALSVEARIVIMDEPTASLSHKEIAELYELIERLKAEGKAILFISHKFDEIFRIADRYCVFRDGEGVGAGLIGETDHNALVRLMVGRSVDQIFPKTKARNRRDGACRLRLQPPDRIRGYRLRAAPGRDPGLLRPGRRGAQRSDAGAVRHHEALRRHGTDRRQGGGHPQSRRRDRPRHRLRPRGARAAGHHRRPADLPEYHASLAIRRRRAPASCAWPRNSSSPANMPPVSELRAASLRPRCRHLVGRQPAEGGDRQMAGDRPPRSSSSTSRPRASTSAPRPPSTHS